MVMKMTKFRLGFSLFETFVVMAIVGIFIALMANTVAHRPKAKLASEAHGRFECYYDESGQLWQLVIVNRVIKMRMAFFITTVLLL